MPMHTLDEEFYACSDDDLYIDEKGEKILSCLNGRPKKDFEAQENENTEGDDDDDNDEYVDLWQLRELALSRGGLLSPIYRKCAWPKLLGIQEEVLRGEDFNSKQQRRRSLDIHEKILVKSSVKSTFYNIHEFMNLSREGSYWKTAFHSHRSNDNTMTDSSTQSKNKNSGGFDSTHSNNATSDTMTTKNNDMLPETPKGSFFPSSPVYKSSYSNSNGNSNGYYSSSPLGKLLGRLEDHHKDDDSYSSCSPPSTPLSFQTLSTIHTSGSIANRSKKKRKATNRTEQSILYNIITNVLRVEPAKPEHANSFRRTNSSSSSLGQSNSLSKAKSNSEDDDDKINGTSIIGKGDELENPEKKQSEPQEEKKEELEETEEKKHDEQEENSEQEEKEKQEEKQEQVGQFQEVQQEQEDLQDGKEQQQLMHGNHFFDGLQDLVALIIINVECPSIAKLMLIRLASFQLKDSLYYPNNNNNQKLEKSEEGKKEKQQQRYELEREQYREDVYNIIIKLAFMPLLKQVDPELHQYLIDSGLVLEIPMSWIFSWFVHDIQQPLIISRLIDVFLASHALMPVYMAVAMITYPKHRSKILQTKNYRNISLDAKISKEINLRSIVLSLDEIQDKEEMTNAVEDIIQLAVSYMGQLSPIELINLSKKIVTISPSPLLLESITMFHDPPEWATVSVAQSDWTLLQRAKQRRLQQKQLLQEKDNEHSTEENENKGEEIVSDANNDSGHQDDGCTKGADNSTSNHNSDDKDEIKINIGVHDNDDKDTTIFDQPDVEKKYPLAYSAAGISSEYLSDSNCRTANDIIIKSVSSGSGRKRSIDIDTTSATKQRLLSKSVYMFCAIIYVGLIYVFVVMPNMKNKMDFLSTHENRSAAIMSGLSGIIGDIITPISESGIIMTTPLQELKNKMYSNDALIPHDVTPETSTLPSLPEENNTVPKQEEEQHSLIKDENFLNNTIEETQVMMKEESSDEMMMNSEDHSNNMSDLLLKLGLPENDIIIGKDTISTEFNEEEMKTDQQLEKEQNAPPQDDEISDDVEETEVTEEDDTYVSAETNIPNNELVNVGSDRDATLSGSDDYENIRIAVENAKQATATATKTSFSSAFTPPVPKIADEKSEGSNASQSSYHADLLVRLKEEVSRIEEQESPTKERIKKRGLFRSVFKRKKKKEETQEGEDLDGSINNTIENERKEEETQEGEDLDGSINNTIENEPLDESISNTIENKPVKTVRNGLKNAISKNVVSRALKHTGRQIVKVFKH